MLERRRVVLGQVCLTGAYCVFAPVRVSSSSASSPALASSIVFAELPSRLLASSRGHFTVPEGPAKAPPVDSPLRVSSKEWCALAGGASLSYSNSLGTPNRSDSSRRRASAADSRCVVGLSALPSAGAPYPPCTVDKNEHKPIHSYVPCRE